MYKGTKKKEKELLEIVKKTPIVTTINFPVTAPWQPPQQNTPLTNTLARKSSVL